MTCQRFNCQRSDVNCFYKTDYGLIVAPYNRRGANRETLHLRFIGNRSASTPRKIGKIVRFLLNQPRRSFPQLLIRVRSATRELRFPRAKRSFLAPHRDIHAVFLSSPWAWQDSIARMAKCDTEQVALHKLCIRAIHHRRKHSLHSHIRGAKVFRERFVCASNALRRCSFSNGRR